MCFISSLAAPKRLTRFGATDLITSIFVAVLPKAFTAPQCRFNLIHSETVHFVCTPSRAKQAGAQRVDWSYTQSLLKSSLYKHCDSLFVWFMRLCASPQNPNSPERSRQFLYFNKTNPPLFFTQFPARMFSTTSRLFSSFTTSWCSRCRRIISPRWGSRQHSHMCIYIYGVTCLFLLW